MPEIVLAITTEVTHGDLSVTARVDIRTATTWTSPNPPARPVIEPAAAPEVADADAEEKAARDAVDLYLLWPSLANDPEFADAYDAFHHVKERRAR